MVITKVRDCVGGQVSITSYFPLTLISLCAAWLVSRAPRVSPVLLLSAPSLRVNIHKVGQRGHWNNKMKCLGSDSPTKEAHRAE